MKRTGNQVLGSTTLNIPVAAGENMKECTIAAINASGYAVTGKKAEGLVKAGMVVVGADNTGGAAGAVNVRVQRGDLCVEQRRKHQEHRPSEDLLYRRS